MPKLGLSELTDFERFNNELKAHSKLNSTTIKNSGSSKINIKRLGRKRKKGNARVSNKKATSDLTDVPQESSVTTSLEKPQSSIETLKKWLEDGEVLKDEERYRSTDLADDDCVCIEPDVEKIVIDDETEMFYFQGCTSSRIVDHSLLGQNVLSNDLRKAKISLMNNDDIIILDDDSTDEEAEPTSSESNKVDESVIFVSETLPDFIPLVSDNVPKPLIESEPIPVVTRKRNNRNSLFTPKEKELLEIYNRNTYYPNASVHLNLLRRNSKRTVIIDGNNIGFAHSRNKSFSAKGLQICIEYFQRMGHEVKAVIPSYRLDKMKVADAMIQKLYSDGILVGTPCKNLPGKSSNSYDDRFILQLASYYDGAIVSNDNYRDLINENAAFKKLIENRVIGYTWCDDMFMLPKDPYGKFGPTLHSILNREIEGNS